MNKPIVTLLLLYLIAGVLYATAAPIMEVSDEPRHVAMVEWLARGNPLPIQNPDQHGPYEQEGSQPPLYYWAMAGVAQLFDRSDYDQVWVFNPHSGSMGQPAATTNRNQMLHRPDLEHFPWQKTTLALMVMRFLGVLMGGVAVMCAWSVGRELWAEGCGQKTEARKQSVAHRTLFSAHDSLPSTLAPLLPAALTAFNPMFLHIMASVNNDTMAVMWSSLALALGARMIRVGLSRRSALLLGTVLGCAALTKSSGLALVLVVPVFVLAAQIVANLRNSPSSPSPRHPLHLRSVIHIALPLLFISAWWYVRNGLLYGGDVTGTQMMAQIVGARPVPASMLEIAYEWGSFLWAYWGLFGALNIALPVWVYDVFEGVWVIAGTGLAIQLVKWLRLRRVDKFTPKHLIGGMLVCVLVLAFGALLRWTSITLASQGRLLFPVIVAISVLTTLGLIAVIPRKIAPIITMIVMGGLAALAFVVPFAYIRPAYARPTLLNNESELPSDLHKTELLFADSIRWLGYTTDRTRITQPDREINVTLYWQALKPISQNLSLGLRLYGRTGMSDTQLLVLDTYPGGGMWPTHLWQPGQIIADRYLLRVPDTPTITQLLPTVVKLDAAFYRDLNGRDFITDTRTPAGEPAPRQFYPIAGLAAPLDAHINTATPQAQFSHADLLMALAQQDGRRIRLNTLWHCTQDVNEDYTLFVQLTQGDDPTPKAPQADGPIDRLPLRWWRKGDVVADAREFTLPADLPPGQYHIKLGFYKPVEPYARMPVLMPATAEQAFTLDIEIKD